MSFNIRYQSHSQSLDFRMLISHISSNPSWRSDQEPRVRFLKLKALVLHKIIATTYVKVPKSFERLGVPKDYLKISKPSFSFKWGRGSISFSCSDLRSANSPAHNYRSNLNYDKRSLTTPIKVTYSCHWMDI